MRFSTLPFLAVALSPAARAACPYAAKSSSCPYSGGGTPATSPSKAATGKDGVFFMNRIAPSGSTLYIANADGSNERPLLKAQDSVFEYHGHFAPHGQYVVFTREAVDGNSDIYRVNLDGSGLKPLVATSHMEDSGVVSPDGTKLAYVSTANGFVSNIWVLDMITGKSTQLTHGVQQDSTPSSSFRPQWSPDGQWIVFSSDRNTDWTGHSNGTGWEHTQKLSIYVVRPDGTHLREVASQDEYCLGSPTWSADGSRLVYYNITVEGTYGAHGIFVNGTDSQIHSLDFATGGNVIQHTSGAGVKISPYFVNHTSNIGYLVKGVPEEGLNYTSPTATQKQWISNVRSPSWSADGTKVIYERTNWDIRPLEKKLYSWQDDWEYRFMDVFPLLNLQGRLAYTQKQTGYANASIINSLPNGTDAVTSFDTFNAGKLTEEEILEGLGGSFQPTWGPTGETTWIAFGVGAWFFDRAFEGAWLYRATANGSFAEVITGNEYNAGFPSYSPDGTQLVFRAWDNSTGAPLGLKLMNMTDGSITSLTNGWDNTPGWSPDGSSIVFARNTNWTTSYGARWYADRFEICTINPDGTNLKVLTTSGANDAHAVWTADNRIMYNSGMYGFRDESPAYDNTFQPYGAIVIMNRDGSNKTLLTESTWEDSMPLYVPNKFLE